METIAIILIVTGICLVLIANGVLLQQNNQLRKDLKECYRKLNEKL
jgi:hypothetical protein